APSTERGGVPKEVWQPSQEVGEDQERSPHQGVGVDVLRLRGNLSAQQVKARVRTAARSTPAASALGKAAFYSGRQRAAKAQRALPAAGEAAGRGKGGAF